MMCSTSFSERERRSSFQTTTASPSRSAPAYGAARVGPNGQGEIRDRTFENQSFRASGLSLIAAAIALARGVERDRGFADSPLEQRRFELVWGFSCQVVVLVLLPVLLFGAGRPFFVPSPTIRFAERAEGVKGPKR